MTDIKTADELGARLKIERERWESRFESLAVARDHAEADNARLRTALEYVLEDNGLVPRATSKCREIVRAVLEAEGG